MLDAGPSAGMRGAKARRLCTAAVLSSTWLLLTAFGSQSVIAPDQLKSFRALGEEVTSYAIKATAVHSIVDPKSDRTYEVFIKLPPKYNDPSLAEFEFPAVFLLDGPYCFETAVGVSGPPMRHGGFQQVVLVGISYAQGESPADSRRRDYTPSITPSMAKPTGQAAAHLAFLKETLIPYLESHYRLDSRRRTLSGQSYGALFGAFAMLEEPELFESYILTSTSLWFDAEWLIEHERKLAVIDQKHPKGRVYFAIGETETPAINGGDIDMVADQASFVSQLKSRNHPELAVRAEVVEQGTHLTTFPVGFLRGMMWLYQGPDPYGG